MDYLIFYKKDTDLKTSVKEVIFSRKSPYTLSFAMDMGQLSLQLKRYPQAILYYFTDALEVGDRVLLKKLQVNYKSLKICLCSEAQFALDAWKLDVFHFLNYPVQSSHLKNAFTKYRGISSGDEMAFKLKSNEGLFKLNFSEVSYISAEGNYSDFYTTSGKKYTQIGKLKEYEFATELDLALRRLHRSYIFNLHAIKKLGKGSIEFYGGHYLNNLSEKLIRKVKSELLGNG